MINLIGNNIISLKSVDSTNYYLRKLINSENLNNGTIVYANKQTLGRGQRGSTWESEEGKNILMSFVFIPEFISAENQFLISKAASLSIFDLLSEYTNKVKIKWPNDIYISDKKIAGILIENSLRGSVISNSIIGIGLNINQLNFKKEIPNPTSLFLETKINYDVNEIFKKLIGFLNARFNSLILKDFNKINNDYLENLYRINEFHFFEAGNNTFKAKIIEIDKIGKLILEHENGDLQSFTFKEVKFI
ncbi:MAG: biotin--[acetyl-CoA-carboxylase] ligase [Bacteroidales bacterium]|nr:biotin--[acetyl-CoA-carboxylase] ligase [Bacteroidales bacterium]MBN2755819.1 biotin--[acetyl-CoA-carboxylase] ligase [Bacteroidales bacterium]